MKNYFSRTARGAFFGLNFILGCVGIAILAVPTKAEAGNCPHWNIKGFQHLVQSNGPDIGFSDTAQDGDHFVANVAYYTMKKDSHWYCKVAFCGEDPVRWPGRAEGSITGDDIAMKVYWADNTVGIYSGTISQSGRADGSTYNAARPSIVVTWFSEEGALICSGPGLPPASPIFLPKKVHVLHTGNSAPVNPDSKFKTVPMHVPGGDAPDGPRCLSGYVWREARPTDLVCVPPESRDRTARENSQISARVDPNGAWGPNSCISGFVWREAYEGDVACVTPEVRALVKEENRLGPSRTVSN